MRSASGIGQFPIDFNKFMSQQLKFSQCINGYASLENIPFTSSVYFYGILTANRKVLQEHFLINPNKRRAGNENKTSGKNLVGIPQVKFTKKIRLGHMKQHSPNSAKTSAIKPWIASLRMIFWSFWTKFRRTLNSKPNVSVFPTYQPFSISLEPISLRISKIPATGRS